MQKKVTQNNLKVDYVVHYITQEVDSKISCIL